MTVLEAKIAVLACAIAAIIFIVILFFSNKVTRAIVSCANVAKSIANGELDQHLSVKRNDEIGDLAKAINKIIENSIYIQNHANQIARGNLTENFEPRSKNDELGVALSAMSLSLKDVVLQANQIASGNYSSEIKPHSNQDELGFALKRMTESLKASSEENDMNNWLHVGQNELAELLRVGETVQDIADAILPFIVRLLTIPLAAIYQVNKQGETRLLSSYGINNPQEITTSSLILEVVKNKQSIFIQNIPENYFSISSATGEAVPSAIIVLPILFNNEVIAIIELASFNPLLGKEIIFLERVNESIALTLNSVSKSEEMHTLLTKTTSLAKELEGRNIEVDDLNENLTYKNIRIN